VLISALNRYAVKTLLTK